jgi:hypothetical protein
MCKVLNFLKFREKEKHEGRPTTKNIESEPQSTKRRGRKTSITVTSISNSDTFQTLGNTSMFPAILQWRFFKDGLNTIK